MIYEHSFKTPLGKMTCLATDEGVYLLEFKSSRQIKDERNKLTKLLDDEVIKDTNKIINSLKSQLKEYFRGQRKKISIPLKMTGTDFQKKVWGELLLVPYGETRTYMEQTKALGDEKAIRAVASANGKNKIAIVVPCHRIIGADGSLTGYAGGVERKRSLLQLEGSIEPDLFS